MKQSIQRRLLRIEEAFTRGRDEQGRTPADILRERRKRRLEENGEQYVEPPPLPPGLRSASLVSFFAFARLSRLAPASAIGR